MSSMLRLAIAVFILSVNALACSFFPPIEKVSRSFTVRVKNEVGAVVGLKLKVSRFKFDEYDKLVQEQQRNADPAKFEEIFAESVTDADGTARFTLAKTGSFTLSPVSPASQLDWVELDVSEQSSSGVVELRWPSYAILRTSLLRGKLMKGLYSSHSVPLKQNALRLHTPYDYR
jgi:hypothetical protein